MTRETALKQETRARIYDTISADPGIHYSALRKGLVIGNGALAYHLMTLERESYVKRRRSGTRVRFYPTDRGRIRMLPDRAAELLRTISGEPGIGQTAVAKKMDMTRQTLHYHVRQAKARGYIDHERRGRDVLMRLSETCQGSVRECTDCRRVFEHATLERECPRCNGPLVALGR